MLSRLLLATALTFTTSLAAGCGDGAGAPAAPNTLKVEVALLNPAEGVVAVADVSGGPQDTDGGAGWTTARVAWARDAGTGQLTVPCDPALNPYEVRVTAVGVYDVVPEALGAVGAEAPPGSRGFQNPGEVSRVVDCVADTETLVQFDLALMRPAQQGFVDLVVNLDAGAIGDAVADLWFDAGDHARYRVSSGVYGGGTGSFSFVSPCEAFEEDDPGRTTVVAELLGIYPTELPEQAIGAYGEATPGGSLEFWEPPPLSRHVRCAENQDVFVQFDVTLARVERDDAVVRARFAGVACGAMWLCEHGDPASATLELTCDGAGAAPALYLDDLVLRCDGAEDVRIPPAPAAATVADAGDGRVAATWRVAPFGAEGVGPGPCTLSGRGTAAPVEDPPHLQAPIDDTLPAGHVYPTLTWSLPVTTGGLFSCQRARLGHGGPISVEYTSPATTEPTRFGHRSAPLEDR